jgi:hypothetical protein
MTKNLTYLSLYIIVACFIADNTQALPRFALWRAEANCLGCHTNPSGGGLRSSGGEAFSKSILAMWKRNSKIKGQLNESIRIGADIRNQYLSFSQTLPITDSLSQRDTTYSNDGFHAMSLALYLDAEVAPSLHAFIKYDPIASRSEMYGLIDLISSSGDIFESDDIFTNLYVKFGAFAPAFGVRFDDHTIYSKGGNRGLSGYGPAGYFWVEGYRDVGAELGVTLLDRIGIQAGIYNGSESSPGANFNYSSQDKAISLRATASNEFIEDMISLEAGYSLYNHPIKDFSGADKTIMLNAFHFGLRTGPVTIISEISKGENIYHSSGSVSPKVNALTIESSIKIIQGIDGIFRYENFTSKDKQDNIITDVKGRLTFGLQWFPMPMLEIRPEFRTAKIDYHSAQSTKSVTENTILVQSHLFF